MSWQWCITTVATVWAVVMALAILQDGKNAARTAVAIRYREELDHQFAKVVHECLRMIAALKRLP